MSGAGALLWLQLLGAVAVQGTGDSAAKSPATADYAKLQEEELLLFAVGLDGLTLTESLAAYGNPQDPLIPVGELARLLDLNVTASPAEGTITGTLGESQRALSVDLGLRLVRAGGRSLSLESTDVGLSPTDIYIRASVLQQLLPLKIQVDPEALQLNLTATEKLPIQARMERQKRMVGVNPETGADEPVLLIESPYRMFTAPAFDVALETGTDTRAPRFPRRYDVRVAGDLFHMGYQGYFGSDEAGSPSTARMIFERRSRDGGLLGPLDATYYSAGDVFTPALALGPRSAGGRGVSFTTAPLSEASVFQRITLRGELPIGYDVELYINDVLRSGQRSPVEGRYEFLDVPLLRGLNVIRLVTYGPRGERSEQMRVINVGGGQLAKGELTADFGLVQQEQPLFTFNDQESDVPSLGKLRAVAGIAYGLSSGVTLVGGAAVFPGGGGERRPMLSAGARGSLFGLALQADAARDLKGGTGLAAGLAGQPFGISSIIRHSEYLGGFIDENLRIYDASRPIRRHSEVTLDMSLPRIGGKIIPLSLRVDRDGFVDGGVSWTAIGRASATIANTLLSTGLDYQREARPETPFTHRLSGNVAASKFIQYKWQLRGVLDFDLVPETSLRALVVTAASEVSDRLGLRLGLGRTFGTSKDLSLQAGTFFRLPFADLALTGDYATAHKDWRLGLRLAFGLGYDPSASRYRAMRPGPAAGGSALFHAFLDQNGNGRFDAGDEAVPRVVVEGGDKKVLTGADGKAYVTGLGNSVSGRLRASIDNIDSFYVRSPPATIGFAPRPGQILHLPYALAPVAEVAAKVVLKRGDDLMGLSAVRVRLVREGAEPVERTTEFDGSVVFSDVRPGTYRLELDEEQAKRLNMRLREPVTVTATVDGVEEVTAEVEFVN